MKNKIQLLYINLWIVHKLLIFIYLTVSITHNFASVNWNISANRLASFDTFRFHFISTELTNCSIMLNFIPI